MHMLAMQNGTKKQWFLQKEESVHAFFGGVGGMHTWTTDPQSITPRAQGGQEEKINKFPKKKLCLMRPKLVGA